MALTSRLAAAEDGLLAALTAALSPVAVFLGDPGSVVPAEAVWLSEDAMADQVSDLSSQSTPAGGREESFELRAVVWTTAPGDDYTTLRNRATTLTATVESTVAANRTLGGAVEDCQVTHIERHSGATGEGRAIQVDVIVSARSWLA